MKDLIWIEYLKIFLNKQRPSLMRIYKLPITLTLQSIIILLNPSKMDTIDLPLHLILEIWNF